MKKATVIKGTFNGEAVRIEGTDEFVMGQSWMQLGGNPAAMKYAIRAATDALPLGGTVYYGKHENSMGDFFHESELVFE